MAGENDIIEIKTSWLKAVGLLMVGIALTAGSILAVRQPFRPQTGSWEHYLGFSSLYFGIALFGAAAGLGLWQLLTNNKPVIRITPQGIEDLRSNKPMIPWSAVNQIGWWSSPGVEWLILGLTPAVQARLSQADRKLLASNAMLGIDGLTVNCQQLAMRKKTLIALCEKAVLEARTS